MERTEPRIEDYERWSRKLFALTDEVESAHGEPPPGCNPTELEMALHLALNAANRRCRSLREPALAAPSPEAGE